MKRGERFSYYTSQQFNKVVDDLMRDFNIKTKKRFFSLLVQGEIFQLNLIEETVNNQLKKFLPNKSQLEKMDRCFFKTIKGTMINKENLSSAIDYEDIDELIKNIHAVDSENIPVSKWKESIKTAVNGKALTPFSKEFLNCYTTILRDALYKFDYEIAEVQATKLDENDSYIQSLKSKLKTLPEAINKKETNKSNDIKQSFLRLEDEEIFLDAFNRFTESEQEKSKGELKEINDILVSASNELIKVKNNNELSKIARENISIIMNEINTKNIKKVSNFDYLHHLINNIQIIRFKPEPQNEQIIKEVKSLMTLLNDEIHDYNIMKKNKKSSQNEILKKILKVKLTLRMVSMKIYNLVK